MRRATVGIFSIASAIFAVVGFALLFLPALGAGSSSPARLQVRGVALAHAMRGGGGDGSEACRKELAKIAAGGGERVRLKGFGSRGGVDRAGGWELRVLEGGGG